MIGKTIVAAAVLGAAQMASAAVILTSFESPGDILPSVSGTTFAQSTNGATAGSFSMAATPAGNAGFLWSSFPNWDSTYYTAWKNNPILKMDIQMGPNAAGANMNLAVAVNGAMGWQDEADIPLPGYDGNPTGWPWVNANQTINTTFVWDFTALAATAPATGTFFQVSLCIRSTSTTGPTMYIDNIRLEAIPEPASLGLLGLASLALGRRRHA